MPYSHLQFRALNVLHISCYLFNKYGFHKVRVDRIIESAKIKKATFYNYFHSKERLIEMSLTFQQDGLKQEVLSTIYVQKDFMLVEKLRKIYFLHTDLDGLYHLLFKAILEIPNLKRKILIYSRAIIVYEVNYICTSFNLCSPKI